MLGEGIEQLYVFAVFFALAVGLAAVYLFGLGLFRGRLAGTIFDCIWGAAALWLTWRVNLAVNNGQCRLYVFVALFAGATLACLTCKSMLDKASGMLYNLFTTKLVDNSDGSNLLQENNLNTVRDSDIGSSDIGMHAVGKSHATVVTKRSRSRAKRPDSARRRRHRVSKKRIGG